jgi:tol-pal system protein YbgF
VIPSICNWRGSRLFLGAIALAFSALSLTPSAEAQQGDDSTTSRINRLEQQFQDLQVSVGTLESLLRSKPGAVLPQEAPQAAPDAGANSAAIDPNTDRLAGSAQYWIGESSYVRRQYKSAADAFLRGYKKYKGSDKAPDTLLKLGMSLAELGQKDAACSTFSEVTAKYPNAPERILDEAKGERKKTGC